MSWSSSQKDSFYNEVKWAVISGASPTELMQELKNDYYLALQDMKRQAEYEFAQEARRG